MPTAHHLMIVVHFILAYRLGMLVTSALLSTAHLWEASESKRGHLTVETVFVVKTS